MREKKLWLVITFHTTAAAIAMEKLCRAKGLPGRLIPVPRELTAECGMSWRAEVQDRAALAALTEADGKVYAIPVRPYVEGLFVNTDLFTR